jgi:hypothetical protein
MMGTSAQTTFVIQATAASIHSMTKPVMTGMSAPWWTAARRVNARVHLKYLVTMITRAQKISVRMDVFINL